MSNIFYGKIRGNSIEFEPQDEKEWQMFTAANQGRKIYLDVGFETRQRTTKQNSALHLAFTMLAQALNDGGLEMRKVLKADIPWSADTVKVGLYKPLMEAKLLKKSTTELTKQEVSDIWELLMRELGEKFQLEYIQFPSK